MFYDKSITNVSHVFNFIWVIITIYILLVKKMMWTIFNTLTMVYLFKIIYWNKSLRALDRKKFLYNWHKRPRWPMLPNNLSRSVVHFFFNLFSTHLFLVNSHFFKSNGLVGFMTSLGTIVTIVLSIVE